MNIHQHGPAPVISVMLAVTDELEAAIQFEGPETVAAVFLEPVQNAGGCFTPPDGYFARVREICDRYGVLLVSDEVICAFGRLGHTFGAERYDYLPDIITCAKGLTSGYQPLGAVIVHDRVARHFDDNLLACGLLGVGRDRILKVEDHPVDRQRLRLVQRPRIRSWHVQHAAPRADSHCGLQLSSAWSLASAMRMRHCCNGLPEPVMACFV